MTNEELLLEIATARAERDAALGYARAESRKAQSAEHWRSIAETQLSKAKAARRKIYDILKAHGYRDGSCYGELKTPAPEFRVVVEQNKRATYEDEILQIVAHLLADDLGSSKSIDPRGMAESTDKFSARGSK